MVKDLAEAEDHCMRARYYETVTEAMKSGGNTPSSPSAASSATSTYATKEKPVQYKSAMSAKDDTDAIGELRTAMKNASPEQRSRMRNEVLALVG